MKYQETQIIPKLLLDICFLVTATLCLILDFEVYVLDFLTQTQKTLIQQQIFSHLNLVV